MGARKRNVATQRKATLKNVAYAKLNDCPTSPRKMRLVADMIRGKRVDLALAMLRLSTKEAAGRLEKLLLSALANWQSKNEGSRIEDQELVVKSVNVDAGRMLKRLRPAPQGRGYRVRKRSNHITIVVDNKNALVAAETNTAN
ncbi:MAG: 50S ribosomal protein L22 [Bacteroidia bacterium]|nr:50S ribosomal protein L22 [Bacteroidia bacterium]